MVDVLLSGNAVALLQKQTRTPHITVIEIGERCQQGIKCHSGTVALAKILLRKRLVEKQLTVARQQLGATAVASLSY